MQPVSVPCWIHFLDILVDSEYLTKSIWFERRTRIHKISTKSCSKSKMTSNVYSCFVKFFLHEFHDIPRNSMTSSMMSTQRQNAVSADSAKPSYRQNLSWIASPSDGQFCLVRMKNSGIIWKVLIIFRYVCQVWNSHRFNIGENTFVFAQIRAMPELSNHFDQSRLFFRKFFVLKPFGRFFSPSFVPGIPVKAPYIDKLRDETGNVIRSK